MRRDTVLPAGHRVGDSGVGTLAPGEVSHDHGRHTHDSPEVFVIVSGSGLLHLDGVTSPFEAGDRLVIDAGEDHHLEAVTEVVVSWLHLEPA